MQDTVFSLFCHYCVSGLMPLMPHTSLSLERYQCPVLGKGAQPWNSWGETEGLVVVPALCNYRQRVEAGVVKG